MGLDWNKTLNDYLCKPQTKDGPKPCYAAAMGGCKDAALYAAAPPKKEGSKHSGWDYVYAKDKERHVLVEAKGKDGKVEAKDKKLAVNEQACLMDLLKNGPEKMGPNGLWIGGYKYTVRNCQNKFPVKGKKKAEDIMLIDCGGATHKDKKSGAIIAATKKNVVIALWSDDTKTSLINARMALIDYMTWLVDQGL